jgi:hypothetical protein
MTDGEQVDGPVEELVGGPVPEPVQEAPVEEPAEAEPVEEPEGDWTDTLDPLERIGTEVYQVPSAVAPGSSGPDPRRYGRLAELAQWWASTDGPAGGPQAATPVWDAAVDRPPDDVDEAIGWGATRADAAADAGADLLLVSAPDRIAGRILAAHLIDLDPVDATGWPSAGGLTDAEWADEVAALRDGLRRVAGLRGTPVPLLRALGSPVVAATTAALLRGCARRVPALLDGETTAAAALLARRIAPESRTWWQLAAGPNDPLSTRIQNSLQLESVTTVGLRVEDGTAARIALFLLREAARLPEKPAAGGGG